MPTQVQVQVSYSGRLKEGGYHMNHISAHSLSIRATDERVVPAKNYNLAVNWVSRNQAFARFPLSFLYTDVELYA